MSIDLEDEPDRDDEGDEILSELGDLGCLFPEECLMPGAHYTGECHTAEMLEDYYQDLHSRV